MTMKYRFRRRVINKSDLKVASDTTECMGSYESCLTMLKSRWYGSTPLQNPRENMYVWNDLASTYAYNYTIEEVKE